MNTATPHVNTRIAKHLQGALTAFIEQPNEDTYQVLQDEIEAYACLHDVHEADDFEPYFFDSPEDLYAFWS